MVFKSKGKLVGIKGKIVGTNIKLFSILPNKKGKVVVTDLRSGKQQTIKQHIAELKKGNKK